MVAAERGKKFSFETDGSGARWTYRFEPHGNATVVTETREMFKKRPLTATIFVTLLLGGGKAHDDEMDAGLSQTLEKVKAFVER